MIEVPIDKIIPLEEATLEIKKILEGIKDTEIYVITKDGKPHAAVIDIDYLEHLPEVKSAGETKKINDIGKNNTEDYEDFRVKTGNESPPGQDPNINQEKPVADNPPQAEPINSPDIPESSQNQQAPQTPEPNQPDQSKISKKPEIIQDNMGPWKNQGDDGSENNENPSDPPDLNIG